MRKSIAIVGAGAKAAAIAALASVLRHPERGLDVPEILIFEKGEPGGAWSGAYEFTNGALRLCTPGEKDVGFPYSSLADLGLDVASDLQAKFSWSSFLVATGQMADWVDRGRNHPSHNDWAGYLQWVLIQAAQDCVKATVTRIAHNGSKWVIYYTSAKGDFSHEVDGVVLTGSGDPNPIRKTGNIPEDRVFDAKTFWGECEQRLLAGLKGGSIVVVGDGGSAGAIAAWLAQVHLENKSVKISCLTPLGTMFPRGDGYSERRWFSDPSKWNELHPDHQVKVLDRTEKGVISLHNKDVIDKARNVHHVRGKAVECRWQDDELEIETKYPDNPNPDPIKADYLINATGFDLWGLLRIVEVSGAEALFGGSFATARSVAAKSMLPDLSFGTHLGIPPGLHVPSIAARKHGPGYGNLGCLGLTAKAVLQKYLK
jgi:mycobactin lysine-N-oxygenase